jgi:SAM-dependent methyltransferase
VTAVDLSITSLAYAQRKATELGFSNLDYLQADILNLNQLDKKFDIIESLGVLHHMENPVIGWRILTNMLKPGGVMKVGLYSEFARRQITEIRDEILAKGLGKSKEEIKEFRQSLIESQNENYQQLKDSIDFYSLSTLTDLLFHVQEHQFNLPLISELLDELELKFCGFEARDMGFQFRKYYGENVDIHDLQMWHEFEKENPETFSGMYQFWCQKI